jgi:hypothetical protein
VHALNCGKPIFPLLVAGADSMPPLEGTPAELHGLLNHQKVQLRDEKWDHDLNELVHVLETTHGFVGNQKPVALPQPEVKIEPLNESQMDTALSTLSGWQPGSQQIREKSRKRQKIEQRDGITSGSRRWASGSPVAERVRREDSETDARGLCRWQWQTFCDAIRARTDPFSGGVPQLVSLYNNGNGRIGIEYGLAFGPCLSSP